MKEDFPLGRHSTNRAFNPNFEEEDRNCGYEHCIEGMPFTDQGIDCPVFGHDCPGGISQVETCRKTKGRLRSVPLSKNQEFKLQFFPLSATARSKKESAKKPLSLEEIVGSHFPKLMMIKVQLDMLTEGQRLKGSELQEALRGCGKILDEFLDEVRGLLQKENEE